MNVEIGTVAEQFNFWEYLFLISGIVSLQCTGWQMESLCLIRKTWLTGHENLLHIRVALLRVVMTQDVSSENYNICFRRARNRKAVFTENPRF
jgi:hypothetical protein